MIAPARTLLVPAVSLVVCLAPARAQEAPPAPAASPAPTADDDPVLAKVGAQTIRTGDLLAEFNRQIPLVYYHRKVPPEELAAMRKKAFDQLVEKALIHQDALARGLEATAAEVEAEFRKTLAQAGDEYKDVSAERFAEMLAQFRPLVERRILLDKNEARFAASVPKPDEKALRAVYDRLLATDREAMMPPPEAHLLHIFVAVDPAGGALEFANKKARIEEARAKLAEGKSFAEVARLYSEDPSSAQGGDLGVVKKGSLRVRSIDDAAFALAAGATSEVVQSLYGFHILRCVEVKPRRMYSIEEVGPLLEQWFATEHTKERRQAWLRELRQRFPVQVLAPEFLEVAPAAPAAGTADPGKAKAEPGGKSEAGTSPEVLRK